MPDKESTMKWKVDVSQLKSGMQEAKRSISLANSEFKNATAGLGKWQDSITGVEAKIKQLNTTSQNQEKILNDLRQQYDIVASELGETSPEAEKLAIAINNQEAACKKTKAELDQYNSRLDDLQAGEVDSRNAAEKLTDTISDQEGELKSLKSEYAAAVLEYGKNSTEAKTLAGQIKNLSGELKDNKTKLSNAEKEADKLDKTIDNTGKSAEKAGKGGFTVLKGALASLLADGIKAAANGIKNFAKDLVSSIGEVASFGDAIDKNSQKMGISAEAYQEWDYILQHNGSSIDALKNGMLTLSKQAEGNNEAFAKLGITENDLATLNKEELFAKTIAGLQGMEEGTERDVLAAQLLGGASKELGGLLNASAADTEALRKKVHDLGGVMGNDAVKKAVAFEDALQDFKITLNGIKTAIVTQFLPGVTDVMSGLTALFSGDSSGIGLIQDGINSVLTNLSEKLPDFLQFAWDIVDGLIDTINANLPLLVEQGGAIALEIITGLLSKLPDVLSVGISVIVSLIQGIGEALPTLIPAAIGCILELCQGLLSNIGLIVSAALDLVAGLVEGLTSDEGINSIIDAIPVLIEGFLTGIIQNLPKILSAGISIVGNLVLGLIKSIPKLVSSAKDLCTAIIDAFRNVDWASFGREFMDKVVGGIKSMWEKIKTAGSDAWGKLKEGLNTGLDAIRNIGKNFVEGLWKGIDNAKQWIKDKIEGWVGNVVDFMKKLFGISSPSRLMADAVGKWLPRGLAAGFEKDMPDAKKKMQRSIDSAVSGLKTKVALSVDGISTDAPKPVSGGAAGSVGGRSIVFNQYNNSPKALDRLTVYRETNSLLFGAEVRLQNV